LYLINPDARLTIECGIGDIAPNRTKRPPHFLKFTICFAILFSIWFLMAGIKNRRFPIKYEIIPPMYDIVANTNKNNHGEADFEAHAIKTSGGIIPKIVSETKKNENTIGAEYVATRLFSSELISRT